MSYDKNNIAVIVLAAGLGTRMKSNKAKVLHELLGKPMIMYVTETAVKIAGNNVVIVVGNQADAVKKTVSDHLKVVFSVQEEQLGTGHAVRCALPCLPDQVEQVVILNGDVPLLTTNTVINFLEDHLSERRHVSVLAVKVENPKGYGRIIFDNGMHVNEIIEESDANEEQKAIKTINTGAYCVQKDFLFHSVKRISSSNAQSEFYLTDIVKIGNEEGKTVGALVEKDPEEFVGINNPLELVSAENILKTRLGNMT
jgi:UDP-N-acetylglucosamine diphosphorylase/glucosamine-1-phosphate N-acetyltransferase